MEIARVYRTLTLIGLFAVSVLVLLFIDPVRQDPAYHYFADTRGLLGIPHMLNVLSNLPFVIAGGVGLGHLLAERHGPDTYSETGYERCVLALLCLGIVLVGFGSSYYHARPDSDRLFWDRLPMTITFMTLFDIVVYERISEKWGKRLLLPLLLAGIGSLLYWDYADDLRFYGLVQFYPLVAIPIILWMFDARYTRSADLFIAVGWYALAKVAELNDHLIYGLGNAVSGHTVKHLLAAAATGWIVRMIIKRRLVDAPAEGSGA